MRVIFRGTAAFFHNVRKDLERPHPFAAERVGFIAVRAAEARGDLVLLARSYHPVTDEDYLDDPSVGAMMGPEAIRKALNIALLQPVGMFHVHTHEHWGRPGFSDVDLAGQDDFVPDFFKVRPDYAHGAIVLSRDRAAGRAWLAPEKIIRITEFNRVGSKWWFDIFQYRKRDVV